MNRVCISAIAALVAFAPLATAQEQTRAFLGVFGEDVTADSGQKGVVVRDLVADGPAAKAGLTGGDIILSVDGKDVNGFDDLRHKLNSAKPGDSVSLKVLRNGKETTLEVTLGEAKTPAIPQSPFDLVPEGFRFLEPGEHGVFKTPRMHPDKRPMIGIHMQPLSDSLREKLELDDAQGILIADVIDDSPAKEAGLQSEDVIMEADGKKVTRPEDLRELVAAKKVGDKISLKINRDGEIMSKSVTLKEVAAPVSPFRGERFVWPEGRGHIEQFRRFRQPNVEKLQERVKTLEEQVQELTKKVEELTKNN